MVDTNDDNDERGSLVRPVVVANDLFSLSPRPVASRLSWSLIPLVAAVELELFAVVVVVEILLPPRPI